MDDYRELLEMSAKAYGIKKLDYIRGSDAYYYDDPDTGREQWSPDFNDGQTLRLAVALNMDITVDIGDDGPFVAASANWDDSPEPIVVEFETRAEAIEATRRAVFEFAAAVGRLKQ